MASNTNLFYKLYSTSGTVANAGYTCTSAVDETATSFDITASSSGSAGTITDSNGNTLSSIDLTDLHAEGITQYNTETRILQPYSCCLLQGQEYGLACASYYFLIPKAIQDTSDYEMYVTCDFDVIYNNFTPYKFHVTAEADMSTSFVDLVNDQLEENNIDVTVSLQTLEDPIDNIKRDYLVFLSQKEGYFYYINNLKLTPVFQSEEYPESPFSRALSELKIKFYNIIETRHPVKQGEVYDETTYDGDCDLYKWLIYNYQDAIDNLSNYKQALDLLSSITPDMPEWEQDEIINKANALLAGTAYDLLTDYDLDNMIIIKDIVEDVKTLVNDAKEYYQDLYWLIEDKKRRIPLMKYPNGAFRGIVVIPDWPTNDSDEENAYKSLWVNHIKSEVKLYRPTKEHQFLPKIYGVLSNATVMAEQDCYKQDHPEFNGVSSNMSMQHSIPDGFADSLDTDYIDPYRPEHSIYEDTVYMGQNCYSCKRNIIGLFRYMQYVNENRLWNKVGQGYIIVGNEDDAQSKDKNLPTSLVIYNPNPEPIRIKYMIFS